VPVSFDMREFERAASGIGALQDQIPFALSQSLNDGVDAARDYLITHTWPAHVSVRDANFMKASLTTKGSRATKKNLRVELYDKLGRGHLKLHETGGTKRPSKSKIAIPDRKLLDRRTARGVPKGTRPGKAPNTFRKGDVIYQVTGGKKNRKLKLLYTLKASAPIKGVVPFHADFDAVMRREVARSFPNRIRAAMASRRR